MGFLQVDARSALGAGAWLAVFSSARNLRGKQGMTFERSDFSVAKSPRRKASEALPHYSETAHSLCLIFKTKTQNALYTDGLKGLSLRSAFPFIPIQLRLLSSTRSSIQMTEPNYAVMLYMLASCAAAFIKIAEVLFVGDAHEREDHPEKAALSYARFSAWLPLCLLVILVMHVGILGIGPSAAMWPAGFAIWMALLQEDPSEVPRLE